jgi:hypothetical protein
MYYEFHKDLDIAHKLHEDLVEAEFKRTNTPYQRPQGKCDFDFIIPNGKLECKFDLLSGFTGNACFEDVLFNREWDFLWQTFTYHRIFKRNDLEKLTSTLYERKRVPMGDQKLQGTLIPLRFINDHSSYLKSFISEIQKEKANTTP